MLLICGHSYCMTCITASPLPITCPLCRIVTPGLTAELKKNFALLEVLPHLCPPKLEEKCGECQMAQATEFCGSCGSMCRTCAEKIHAHNLLKNHTVVPIAAKATVLVPMCVDHGEKALLHCSQHMALLCLLCRDYGAHKGCTGILPLAEAAAKRAKALSELASRAEAAQKVDKHTAAITRAQEKARQAATESLAKVNAYFNERLKTLKACQGQMIRLINEEQQRIDRGLNEQRFELAKACSSLQAVAAQAKKVCGGSSAQILQAPAVVFPELLLLRKPRFSAVGFEFTLPMENPSCSLVAVSGEEKVTIEHLSDKRPPKVNQRVQAKWSTNKYFKGVITKVNEDNTFAITFDDGDKSKATPLTWILGYEDV